MVGSDWNGWEGLEWLGGVGRGWNGWEGLLGLRSLWLSYATEVASTSRLRRVYVASTRG